MGREMLELEEGGRASGTLKVLASGALALAQAWVSEELARAGLGMGREMLELEEGERASEEEERASETLEVWESHNLLADSTRYKTD
jgi:hypothetical protein